MQGLPSKLVTHKPRLTTSPLETGSSTLDSTGQFRCRLLASPLVGPLDAHIFSSISTSGPVGPWSIAFAILPRPTPQSEDILVTAEALARASSAASLGSIGPVVDVSRPCLYPNHLVLQPIWSPNFWTSYIYQHPTRIFPLSFRPIRTRTHCPNDAPLPSIRPVHSFSITVTVICASSPASSPLVAPIIFV